MTKYNFDNLIDRRNTNSIKVDFMEESKMPEDIIPMWVADMDFETVPAVKNAIAERALHGIYGYTKPKEDYNEVLIQWMKRRHNWDTKPEWYFYTPGVVFAISMALRALTVEGDSVLIQQPVYHPFIATIEDNNRKLINNSLCYQREKNSDGRYEMDLERFEAQIVENQVKVFLMCNPHNPVGRVWTKEELEQAGDICVKHGVLVISDEIHQDFIYPGSRHTSFAGIKPEFEQISITCTSPSKTFNLAGLQISNIIVPNQNIRKKIKMEIEKTGYDEPNIFGMIACQAAYTEGEAWLEDLNRYLFENLNYVKDFLEEHLPKIKVILPEGTYLVWLDFSELGLSDLELDEKIIHEGKLWLNAGTMFGEEGMGFQRMNIATSREILKTALHGLKVAFQ